MRTETDIELDELRNIIQCAINEYYQDHDGNRVVIDNYAMYVEGNSSGFKIKVVECNGL